MVNMGGPDSVPPGNYSFNCWDFCPIRVLGERSPNGTVDYLSHRPTLEHHGNRSRVAHGESGSAPVIWARCRGIRISGDRMSGC
jgi:hypothetical protein